jgi:anthranilate phosphoribosyltransferase
MSLAHHLKAILCGNAGDGSDAGGGDLSEHDARQLFGAMLDGGVPELELGALLVALQMKPATLAEMAGYAGALNKRLFRLLPPRARALPVVLPSYGGARDQPNLLPLLALLLQRFGVPVLIHGMLNGDGGIASAYVFRELGVMPSATLAQAQDGLSGAGIAFVPTAVLAPGLAELLVLRGRLGVRSPAHTVARLLDPFEGDSLRVVGVERDAGLAPMREFLLAAGAHALLLRGAQGEPYADPLSRPRIEHLCEGAARVLFEAEAASLKKIITLPEHANAAATAAWIRRALAGETPLPLPIVNQLATCLFAAGYTSDMNQAKAIVAVETGSLAAA